MVDGPTLLHHRHAGGAVHLETFRQIIDATPEGDGPTPATR
jgi:hypothetical protein